MIEGKAEQRGGRLVFVVVETSEPIGSDELLETETELPAKHAVCARCEGHGTHMREGMADHAYTAEEFDEAFPDDESREQYFRRGGIYDVTCSVCAGRRVVVVVDEQARMVIVVEDRATIVRLSSTCIMCGPSRPVPRRGTGLPGRRSNNP